MYCINCGTNVPDGSKFCPKCGMKLIDTEGKNAHESPDPDKANQEDQQAQGLVDDTDERPIQKHRGMIIAAISVAVVIIGLVIVIIVGINSGKATIDLNKYLTITTEGYDGSGTASFYIDTDRLESDYAGKINFPSDVRNYFGRLVIEQYGDDPVYMITSVISGSLSKDSGLSNGDVITFRWSMDNSLDNYLVNANLKMEDFEYTVSDLEPADYADFPH